MSEFLEHDGEHSPGIPAALPASERLLWRGSPDWKLLARTKFHVNKLAGYFGLMLLLYVVRQLLNGSEPGAVVAGAVGFGLLAGVALALVLIFARATARSTVFSLTNRRLIVRCGVALPLTMNLPLSKIDHAELREHADGSGDIALTPAVDSRASYILLWPYVRPWRWSRVQPMLRAVADAGYVAETLGRALSADATERDLRPSQPAPVEPSATPEPAGSGGFKPYPTVPLAAAVGLVVVTVLATGWVSLTEDDEAMQMPTGVVDSVMLRFEDRADGSIDVIDARVQQTLETLGPDDNGFLRSTLRGLARVRAMSGVGSEEAFSLLRTDDGRLLLIDPVTEESVDLWAFGKTNARSFARYLELAAETTVSHRRYTPTTVALKNEENTQ